MIRFVKIIPLATKIGTVTIKYPYDKPLVTESYRGVIDIDPAKCVGCGACTKICPPKALSLVIEDKTIVLRYFIGRCIFCGMCVDICPEKAIRITKEFELASDEICELYNDIEHELYTCRKCGAKFASVKLLNKIKSMVEVLPEEVLSLCPNCRRIEFLSRQISGRIE